jgi:hypothetical protein
MFALAFFFAVVLYILRHDVLLTIVSDPDPHGSAVEICGSDKTVQYSPFRD